jgi:hypothetical protein
MLLILILLVLGGAFLFLLGGARFAQQPARGPPRRRSLLRPHFSVPLSSAAVTPGDVQAWLEGGEGPSPGGSLSLADVPAPARERPRGLAYRTCLASLCCIAVAYGARQADVKDNILCYPHSFFQLHAAWHCFAALSLWFLWLFLRSEEPPPSALAAAQATAEAAAQSGAAAARDIAAPPDVPRRGDSDPPESAEPLLPVSITVAVGHVAEEGGMLSPRGMERGAALLAEKAALEAEAEAGARGLGGDAAAGRHHLRTRSRGSDAFSALSLDGPGWTG